MTTFQMLWPTIVSGFITIGILFIIYFVLRKYVKDEQVSENWSSYRIINTAFAFIVSIMFIVFISYAIKLASVNEVPRRDIDKHQNRQAESNFERKSNENAATRKAPDTTVTIQK